MNPEKLIQAAEYAVSDGICNKCKHDGKDTCLSCDCLNTAKAIIAVREHVRAEVIAQVREWASKTSVEDMTTECCGRLLAMLDELSKEGMDNARRTVEGAYCD